MKKGLLLAAGLTVISLLLSYLRPTFFEVLEGKLYDIHFELRKAIQSSGKVVLVTIDEKSIQKIGRWPWPRAIFGEAFKKIAQKGARVIAADLFFASPSQGLQGRENDEALARVFHQYPNIHLGFYLFLEKEKLEESALHEEKLEENFRNTENSAISLLKRPSKLRLASGVLDTLPMFSNLPGGHRQGFFNLVGDSDGTLRKTPMVISYRERIFPSLPLQVALAAGKSNQEPLSDQFFLDEQGDFLTHFRGPLAVFPRESFSDVIAGTESTDFQGKIVLIGATADGLEDARPTPIDQAMPSVVVAANIIDNLLMRDLLRRDSWTTLLSRLIILLVGLILGFGGIRLRAMPGFALFLAVTLAQAILLHYFFLKQLWVLQNIYPFFTGFLVYGGTTLYRYLTEEKEKKFISETFQHYLSPDVIQELTKNPDKIRLGGEKKEVTIFFSDIRDFTSIVEATPPEVLSKFLNNYLTPVTDIILDQKGLLDKYIGDAVMAVFGVPLPEPRHPELACRSAVDICRFVKKYSETWQKEFHIPPLQIGIGLNTCLGTVGNMGSERRFDYTVIGDGVNLASRLEGLNKYYGTTILVSQATYEKTKDSFPFREVDDVQVKGKKEVVKIYEILVDPNHAQEELLPHFAEGLERYREGEFAPAKHLFEKCLVLNPKDGPSKIFLERCQAYIKTPPEDWEGFTTFLKK